MNAGVYRVIHVDQDYPTICICQRADGSERLSQRLFNKKLVLADAGKSVLVVDGDLRKGKLNKYFDLSRGPGLSELIRDRPVVGIHAVDLVWGLGTLHCLTREEPAP